MHIKFYFVLLCIIFSLFNYANCDEDDDDGGKKENNEFAEVQYNKRARYRGNMKCNKPQEMIEIFHSCKGTFPASRTECFCSNGCGKTVTLNCYKGKWQRSLFGPSCSKTFKRASKLVKCEMKKGKPSCRCKSNCKKLNSKCRRTRSAEVNDVCVKNTDYATRKRSRNMIQYFENGVLNYVCDAGYKLVGASTKKCNAGSWEAKSVKAKCEKAQSNAGKTDED